VDWLAFWCAVLDWVMDGVQQAGMYDVYVLGHCIAHTCRLGVPA
jgi:hypothetical protein